MGVHPVIIHFRLGFSTINDPFWAPLWHPMTMEPSRCQSERIPWGSIPTTPGEARSVTCLQNQVRSRDYSNYSWVKQCHKPYKPSCLGNGLFMIFIPPKKTWWWWLGDGGFMVDLWHCFTVSFTQKLQIESHTTRGLGGINQPHINLGSHLRNLQEPLLQLGNSPKIHGEKIM